MNDLVTLTIYPQLQCLYGIVRILLELNKSATNLCAGVTMVDFMKYFSADFLSVKTRGFSSHFLAPFPTIDIVVCSTYTFSTYRNKLTKKLKVVGNEK